MPLDEFAHYFSESKISSKQRKKLDDSQFGIPSLRKYPLTDEKHVLQAVRFFNKAPEEHKPELARNIVKRAKELNMDWEKWDVLKPYLDKPVKEAYAKELHSTPEADNICAYLCKSVKYDNASPKTWRLKSPDEVTDHNKGNCHDTAWYVFKNLDAYAKRKVGKGILFFIEYKEGKKEGGQTHSVCYEKIPGGICIIECSWQGMTGTFPYNDIEEYISVVKKNWEFTGDNDKLFATEIKNTSQIHPGMTLSEYVFVAMKNKEIITEAYDPTDDHTSGTSDFDHDDDDPDDCYCESNNNPSETEAFYKRWKEKEGAAALKQAKEIVKKIAKKVEEDEQPPCGNQNCQLCTWCVEAQFRDINALPRPVYSPRDPALAIKGETIVKDPVRISIKNGYDGMLEHLMEPVANVARFYCHVNWNNSTGGHEFIILKISKQNFYIVDAQAGIVEPLSDTGNYFNDINFANSFICRLDNHDFNKELFEKYNDPKSLVPWDGRLDIPYMLEHGMLSEEEAEQYWKEHPDEAPKDRHFLSYEELDKMSESKNIFTSGDFAKYGKDVDLRNARGPIQESFIMEFDRNSEKIPVKNINFDEVYFGSPKKYSRGIRIDRPLFVTPFMGIASIFIWDDMDIQNHVPKGTYNLQYEEWMHASDEELSKPFKEVHVYVEGYPELEPYEIENTGYIHTVNASKYKNDFYRYEGMADKLEYLIDTDDSFVNVTSVQEVTVHYYISGKATNNPKLGPYKKNDQAVQESAWQDIKNGVNPFSKNLVFHISKNGALDGQIFKPRVPEYITKYDSTDPKFEDNTTGRICFSPSIEGCLNAILVNIGRWKTADKLGDWYVYIPEKPLNEYKHSSNRDIIKGKKVYDANLTKEIWIEEPVRLKQYGVIHVDQVKASDRKKTVATSDNVKGDRRYYTFKWHWLVKPKVLKDIPYDYSKHETCENLEEELWRFGYGLIKDGKLMKGDVSEKDWYKYWRLADPEEFEQAKGGNCYDYVEWESGYLDAFGHNCNKIFIKSSTGNNHAFIYVKDESKYIFIDGAFNKIDKTTHIMKDFDSLDKCFKYITDAIKKYEKNDSISFTFYDYTKEDMKPGTPMKEFEEWIISHGKTINVNKPIKKKDKAMSESFNYVQEGLFDRFKPKKQEPPKKYDPEALWTDGTVKIDGKTIDEFEEEFGHNKNFDEIFSLYQNSKFIDAIKKFNFSNKPSMNQHYSSAFKRVAQKIYSAADDDKFEAIRNGFVDGFFPPSRLGFVKYKNASGIVFCEAGAGGKDDIFIVSKDDGKVYYMDCGECNKVTESVVDFLKSFNDHFFDSYLKGQNKHVKEEYNMSDFERDPSVLQMILEAEAEEAEEKENNDDEKGDAIESETEISIEGEAEIGSDVGDVQNEYNPEEVERLNKLINSEMSAVSEYFNAAKESKEPNLMRLFSDIGDEERFHLEQLIYAKSTITGEAYEPQDPKVKKEYQELLDMGMDEETAMTTAVDKVQLMPKEATEDMSEDEAADFEEGFRLISATSLQTAVMLEAAIDTSDVMVQITENSTAFIEQMIIMEEVDNLNTRQGQKDLGSKNPIVILIKAFVAIYGAIINLARKARLAFQKIRLRDKRKWAWIKKHGIGAIFAKGVSFYFFSEKKNMYDVGEPMKYISLIHSMNAAIIKSCNITTISPNKYDVTGYINKLVNTAKGTNREIHIEPLAARNTEDGIRLLQGVSLTKTKVVLTQENTPILEEQFFGYTARNYAMIEKEGENTKNIKLSINVYNQMSILLDALAALGAETKLVMEALQNQEGTQGTTYDKMPGVWKNAVRAIGVMEKSVSKFNAAVAADVSEMLKVNNGLKEAMETADTSGDTSTVTSHKNDVAQQQKANADASKKAAEGNDNTATYRKMR